MQDGNRVNSEKGINLPVLQTTKGRLSTRTRLLAPRRHPVASAIARRRLLPANGIACAGDAAVPLVCEEIVRADRRRRTAKAGSFTAKLGRVCSELEIVVSGAHGGEAGEEQGQGEERDREHRGGWQCRYERSGNPGGYDSRNDPRRKQGPLGRWRSGAKTTILRPTAASGWSMGRSLRLLGPCKCSICGSIRRRGVRRPARPSLFRQPESRR